MKKVEVGDRVTVKEPTEGFYSEYAGNPKITMHPGQLGVVFAVDRPDTCANTLSVCVHFIQILALRPDLIHTNSVQTCAVHKSKLRKI